MKTESRLQLSSMSKAPGSGTTKEEVEGAGGESRRQHSAVGGH